jgi:hypothetical protein
MASSMFGVWRTGYRSGKVGDYASQYVAMAMNAKESDIALGAFNPALWYGPCVSTYTAAHGEVQFFGAAPMTTVWN